MSIPTDQAVVGSSNRAGAVVAGRRAGVLGLAVGANLLLAMTGSWPQRVQLLGGGGYGRLWTVGFVLLVAGAVAAGTPRRSILVPAVLLATPVLVGVGHLVAQRTGAGQLLLQSWAAIALALLVGHGFVAHGPIVDRAELHTWIRRGAALVAGSALVSRLIGLVFDVSGSFNSFGLTAAVAFVAIVALAERPTDALTDAAAWVALAGFVLSPSRAAWLCAAIGLAVLVILRWNRYRSVRARVVVAGALLVVLAATPVADFSYLSRAVSGTDPVAGRAVLSGRMDYWGDTFDEALSEPVLGQGPGAGNRFVAEISSRSAQPHNGYLTMLFDVGIVGLGGFVAGMMALVAGLWPARRDDLASGALALGVGLAVAIFFTNVATYKEVMVPAGLFIGLATAATPLFARQRTTGSANV